MDIQLILCGFHIWCGLTIVSSRGITTYMEKHEHNTPEKGTYEFVYIARHVASQEIELYGYHQSIEAGTQVVVASKFGLDLAEILGQKTCQGHGCTKTYYPIQRIATEEDMAMAKENRVVEAEAFELCKSEIDRLQLDMKLVLVHKMLQDKLLFYFSSDHRVDFRELVKSLVARFHIRVELRQIGVRDEAAIIGGVGMCGRTLCCNEVNHKAPNVSIKMAKDQNLSLNSEKISGCCGRLLCCLSYEEEFYREEQKKHPSVRNKVFIENESFHVADVNLLTRKITLYGRRRNMLLLHLDDVYRSETTNRWEADPGVLEESN